MPSFTRNSILDVASLALILSPPRRFIAIWSLTKQSKVCNRRSFPFRCFISFFWFCGIVGDTAGAHEFITNVRNKLYLQNAGSAAFTIARTLPQGDAAFNYIKSRLVPVQYYWTVLNFLPFVVVFSVAREDLIQTDYDARNTSVWKRRRRKKMLCRAAYSMFNILCRLFGINMRSRSTTTIHHTLHLEAGCRTLAQTATAVSPI